jgi:hypothetical protein
VTKRRLLLSALPKPKPPNPDLNEAVEFGLLEAEPSAFRCAPDFVELWDTYKRDISGHPRDLFDLISEYALNADDIVARCGVVAKALRKYY